MIKDLKPYIKYKGTKAPWLKQIPEHWEVRKLKTICSKSAVYGANMSADFYTETGVRFLRTTDITDEGKLRPGGVFLPEELVREYILSDGDILISRSGTIGRSLRYRASNHGPCAYAGYLVRFVPAPILSSDYLYFFTKSYSFADFIKVMAISATIENVNGDKYANMQLPLPSLPEQAAIVKFLHFADQRIHQYIQTKQKLIKLLEEQKQNILFHTITHGLDPKVLLKKSGIMWADEVPKHWDIVPNRSLLHLKKTIIGEDSKKHRLLSLSKQGVIERDLENMEGKIPANFNTYQEVVPHDLIFCLFDMDETPRTVGLSEKSGMITGAYTVFQCSNYEIAKYIYYFYLAMDNGKRLKPLYTGLRKVIQKSVFLGAKFPLPPANERIEILAHIEKEFSKINLAISRATDEIRLLKEYRSVLISNVVTGNLDVREAVAQLPEVETSISKIDESDNVLYGEDVEEAEESPSVEEIEA